MARGTAGLRPAWGLAGCVLVWWWLWDTAGFLRPCASGAPVPSRGAGQRALGVCWCGLERLEGVLLAGVWPLLSPDVCSCCVAPAPPLQMAQGVLGTGWALNLPLCPLLLPGRTPGGVWQGGHVSGMLLSSRRPALRWAEVPVCPRLGAC